MMPHRNKDVTKPFKPPFPRENARDNNLLELALRFGFVAALGLWAFDVIRPFSNIIIWSAVLTVALYPVYRWFSNRLGGIRWLPSILTTLLTLAVVIGPMTWLSLSLVDGLRTLIALMNTWDYNVPPPPESLKDWPMAGAMLFKSWSWTSTNLQSVISYVLPELKSVGEITLGIASRAGAGALQFLAAVIVSGLLFAPGPRIVAIMKLSAHRIDVGMGRIFVEIAGATIRSVSRGVIGVSILQALVGGVAMSLAAVPFADLLTFAILVFGIVQMGPILVVIGVIIWAWMTMSFWPALLLTAAMASLYALENLLKPFAMAHGLNTPMPVIFVGVIGGILAYGILGLFTGPIILAIAWELAKAFVNASKVTRAE